MSNQVYNWRKAPSPVGSGWLDTEHQAIDRAIKGAGAPGIVPDFGALGDTASIQAAIDAGSVTGEPVILPARTWNIVPATPSTDAAGATTVAFTLRSNTHIVAEQGAILRLADNQSTDAAPKRLYLFFTNTALTNVSVRGLIMDMNGANNKISPNRPVTYDTTKNMAHIGVSGDNARIDDMLIEWCQFLNSPGTNEIIAGQSNAAGTVLGKRWTIAHNLFKNNGTDTSDNSAIYGWTDVMDVHDNIFWEDSPYGTIGHTGSQTAHEVHGHSHTLHDNIVHNYLRGAYLGNNYTSDVYNADIHDNLMEVTYEGVAVSRSGASAFAVRDSKIHHNPIVFTEHAFTGSPGAQIAFNCAPDKAVNDLTFDHNDVSKPGVNTIPAILAQVYPTLAGVSYSNIRVIKNKGRRLTAGVQFRTDGTNGGLGYVESTGNQYTEFVTVAGSTAIGTFVDATNGIKTLVLGGDRFIDERAGAATFERGILMQNGTITDLFTSPQIYKGLITANYAEIGGLVVTNRNGTTHVAGDYALSAGWGVGATVTVVGNDLGARVSITAAGVPAANPTLTLTFKDKAWTVAPRMNYGRGDIAAPTTGVWSLTTASATAPVFTFSGTPVAASVYILDFTAVGK